MGVLVRQLRCLIVSTLLFSHPFGGEQGSLLDNKIHTEDLALNKNKWSELSMSMVDSGDVSDHPYQNQFEVFFENLVRV